MCAGAIVNSRLDRVVYGCDDPKAGAVRSLFHLVDNDRLNHRTEVTAGVRAEECAALMKDSSAKDERNSGSWLVVRGSWLVVRGSWFVGAVL